jgi:hypothetical protein
MVDDGPTDSEVEDELGIALSSISSVMDHRERYLTEVE